MYHQISKTRAASDLYAAVDLCDPFPGGVLQSYLLVCETAVLITYGTMLCKLREILRAVAILISLVIFKQFNQFDTVILTDA